MAHAPSTCSNCGRPVEGEFAPHLCAACGRPQHVEKTEDTFTAFGVRRLFHHDLKAIERRFYALSRALHPDRFAGSGPAVMAVSLERMSFLNRAFSAFRSPEVLRDALLVAEGIEIPKNQGQQIPVELAEAWFELQEAATEEPETAIARISAFEDDLLHRQDLLNARIEELEQRYDKGPAREPLLEIALILQARSYLFSMGRDVIRLKNRLNGSASLG